MEQRLTYITLGVNDLKRMTDFYENVFGWKREKGSSEGVTFFKLNGIILSLFGREALAEDAGISSEGTGFKPFSLAYNLSSEKEVDELYAVLESKGAKVIKRPQKVFWGGDSSYIADPEDNLWEIAYNPYLSLDNKGDVI